MRVFFFLGRTFLDQSLAIAKEFRHRYPDSQFSALIGARSDTLKYVQQYKDPEFSHITWLTDLEKKWLETPLDKNKLEYYRQTLGTDALRRLIISDRELGIGYISCGVYPDTPLIKATKYDNDKRWAVIVGLLDYLFETFEKERPDFVFSYCIAAAHELAMQIVAKHMGITFTQPMMTHIGSYFLIDDTAYPTLTSAGHSFKKLLNNEANFPESMEKAKKILYDFRNKPAAPEYNTKFAEMIKKQGSIKGAIRTIIIDTARMLAIKFGLFGTRNVIRQRSGLGILLENLNIFRVSRRAMQGKEFESFSKFKDSEYIYYTLHVDPEAATIVMAPYHTDQLAVIEAISKQMPVGMKLLVKEHVPSLGRRPKGFYERIKAMPDVHLIGPFENGFSIMEKAKLTCVITGTAGREAILLGKPVLVVGNMHFTHNLPEDITSCSNLFVLGKAIEEAIHRKPIDEEKLLKYMASIIEEGFEASVNEFWADKGGHDIAAHKQVASTIVNKMLRLHEITNLS